MCISSSGIPECWIISKSLCGTEAAAGNVKRVASAVGEGSIAVAFVHQVLRQ